MRSVPVPVLVLALLAAAPDLLTAQVHRHTRHAGASSRADTAFDALQNRGARVMGVDQYTSSHKFEALPDGGRIELVRDVDDTAGVRAIQEHLRTVAHQFAAGDFSASSAVHAREVPGTAVMRARRLAIRYEFRPLPRGGELRITTADREALRAIHEFLAFQRADHRTGEK
jgi:hypothetical protein